MPRPIEKKCDLLLKQLRSLPTGGSPGTARSHGLLASPNKLIDVLEDIKKTDEELARQKEELLFAYRTLEIAYQHYWEFFNYAPDGYLVTDTDGIIREANQTIFNMLSATRPQLVGQPITSLIPDIRHQGIGIQLSWFMGSQQMEVCLQPHDRDAFFTSLSIAPQYDVQNKPIGLLWLIRDISERKEMEQALLKSRAELELILAQIPCVLWTTDAGLKITSATGTGLAVVHLSPEDIVGHNIQDYFTSRPDLIITLTKAHRNALSGISQVCEFEWEGHIFQSIVKPLKDSNDQITGVITASFDITERKQAEKDLQQSESFNSSLLENSPYPILVIRADTSIGYVNPAFERLTGFSAGRITGQKAPYPWWVEADGVQALELFRKNLQKKSRQKEQMFKKKNGDTFWVELTSTWIHNEDETGYQLQTWVNVTEARHLRENMEYYMMQITRIQEDERRRIAQELHEETVQSLAALCLATEAIIKAHDDSPQDLVSELRKLREKINGVIDEVRRFSHDLRPGVLDYLGLTASLESLTEEMCSAGIHTCLNISGKEAVLSPDMETTLFRIAQEACRNARKYSRASRMNIDVQYTRSKIKLSLTDNGAGFCLPERLSDFAGDGKLGLIGMEERARLFGGAFSLQSQPGKGTRITVILPLSKGKPIRQSHPYSVDRPE